MLGNCKNPYIYMKLADWLICTSRHEGFNMVLHEAIYCETPIITTRNAGTIELLGDNRYGIVLNNDDESILNGMRNVLKYPELREKYVHASKERKAFIDIDYRVNKILELL